MNRPRLGAGIIILALIIIAIVALVIHNGSDKQLSPRTSNPAGSTTQSATDWTVDIKNMMFTPSQVTISKGGTVTWKNDDNISHTVDVDQGEGPHSSNIAPGQSFSYTFYKTGSYQYHCRIHSSMRGTIVVR
ncbi:MAG TPA: cupredoxin domain-containing protein [Candidatus Saccharimonadales bacterium]|nr:cupredoxin domain-containing protein [Candidatus Saccharimonadales bacterium]